ncbi:MAG: hypothetical protein WCC39_02535, partial [Telluria sp.]
HVLSSTVRLALTALPDAPAAKTRACGASAGIGVNCCIPVHFAVQRLRAALVRVIIRNHIKFDPAI